MIVYLSFKFTCSDIEVKLHRSIKFEVINCNGGSSCTLMLKLVLFSLHPRVEVKNGSNAMMFTL